MKIVQDSFCRLSKSLSAASAQPSVRWAIIVFVSVCLYVCNLYCPYCLCGE